jgi:hypothetical protein
MLRMVPACCGEPFPPRLPAVPVVSSPCRGDFSWSKRSPRSSSWTLKDADPTTELPEDEAVPESPAATEAEASAKADLEASEELHTENDSPASGEAPKGYPGHGRNGSEAYTGAEKIEVRQDPGADGRARAAIGLEGHRRRHG